jgi:hypothetical protein
MCRTLGPMAKLSIEVPVGCVPAIAQPLLERAVRAISHDGMLSLNMPLEAPGCDPAAIEQDVRCTVEACRDESSLNDVLAIAWHVNGAVPLPEFRGTIVADWGSGTPDVQAVLRLDGVYTPPAGLIGSAFDAGVGFRLTRATMHDLLQRIARAVEELAADSAVSR